MVDIYGAVASAAMKAERCWAQESSLSPNHWAGDGRGSSAVSMAVLQPFPDLINNLWSNMFYLCLLMKPIFQPDAIASQVTVTCSKHCPASLAPAHPSSSSGLRGRENIGAFGG